MKRVMAIILVMMTGSTFVLAHHSQAAQYDRSKTVTIEGSIVQFQYRNPHSFLHVEAPDDKGEVHRWSIEWGGAAQLTMQGVQRTSLKYGDVRKVLGRFLT